MWGHPPLPGGVRCRFSGRRPLCLPLDPYSIKGSPPPPPIGGVLSSVGQPPVVGPFDMPVVSAPHLGGGSGGLSRVDPQFATIGGSHQHLKESHWPPQALPLLSTAFVSVGLHIVTWSFTLRVSVPLHPDSDRPPTIRDTSVPGPLTAPVFRMSPLFHI